MLTVKYSPPCVPIHATINDVDLTCLRVYEVNAEAGGASYCYRWNTLFLKKTIIS